MVLKVFEGVVYGIVEDIPEIGECITGAFGAADDIVEAVKAFKNGGASNVKKGLKLVGEAIKEIPDVMKACMSMPEEIEKIEKLIASFSNPWTFAYHVGEDILVNGVNIINEVNTAISAYDN